MKEFHKYMNKKPASWGKFQENLFQYSCQSFSKMLRKSITGDKTTMQEICLDTFVFSFFIHNRGIPSNLRDPATRIKNFYLLSQIPKLFHSCVFTPLIHLHMYLITHLQFQDVINSSFGGNFLFLSDICLINIRLIRLISSITRAYTKTAECATIPYYSWPRDVSWN